MKLNADLVRARCNEIEESLRRIERFKTISKEDFLADQDSLDLVCYRLLLAIEAALALCYHVTAKHLRKVPDEYAHCFSLLEEAGLIPHDLSQRLQKMARFRNLLVHMYWEIDYHRVYQVIQENLDDLRAFSRAIAGLL